MGSTSACAAEKSFVSGYGLSYKRDMKLFGGQIGSLSDEFGSLSGSSKGVLADLGLSVAGSARDDSSLKIDSILSMANSMHAHSNPVDAKALKKPEKALPCPRCNSVDTKFCYYNNYNVNQPRHFCKGCQRYWTAGGTLRNVAVGAGQRKRKHTSPDSDSQDSVIEDCIPHDLSPVKLLGRTVSALPKDEFELGPSISLKHQTLPFERIPCTFLSNPPSPNAEKSALSEFMYSKQTVTPFGKVEPPCNLHTFKEQTSTFYEYLLPKHIVAPLDNVRVSHNSFERACDSVYADCSKKGVFNWRMDLQHNECSDVGNKFVPTTSCEMQASNESGCASSLTMQGASVDACVTDGKSDVIDSGVTEETDELDKGGCYATTNLQTTHISPCTTHMDGCASATSSVHYDSSSGARIAPTWERHLENSLFKPTSPIMSPVSTWSPPADKGLSWGFPWGPAASAVDAAKAALIPNAGSAQKCQTETSRPSETRLWVPKTLRIKDADEAARSSIWSTLGIRDREGSVLSKKVEAVFQCQAKGVDGSATQSQHASPVASMHSTAFQESTFFNAS